MSELYERWLPVVGWWDYEVSDLARVRSIDRWVTFKNGRKRWFPGVVLQPHLHLGYPTVRLRNKQTFQVHTLVAEAFLGPRPEGMYVIHGPAGSSDSSLSNIRYGTPVQNQADRNRDGTGTRGTQHALACLTEVDVQEIRVLCAQGVKQSSIAKQFNTSISNVSAIKRRIRWAHV